jgi:hypothetical protein
MQWRIGGGIRARTQNAAPMELASILLRKSLGAVHTDRSACSRCLRVPLIGEHIHELESGHEVCSLCLAGSGGRDGEPVRSERVHATDKPLAVVPRAA